MATGLFICDNEMIFIFSQIVCIPFKVGWIDIDLEVADRANKVFLGESRTEPFSAARYRIGASAVPESCSPNSPARVSR